MHINSLQDLVSFLTIVKEDNRDPAGLKYEKQLESDKENYSIKDIKKKKEPTDESEDFEPEEEIEVEEEETKKITPSLDSLIRNINDLRSGESLKRAEIRNEVGEYFDSLSEEEQSVLVLFLRELAAVVTKSKSGSEAQDPSDKPETFIIKKSESEDSKSQPEQQAQKPRKKVTTTPSKNKDLEDDSAPIRVDESQDIAMLRQRFKILSGKQ
jgi:hypothetical protein